MLFAARGIFLWLMPIGAPPGAPVDALKVYPYSNHSYFPSGHVGLISLCAWLCRDQSWRRFFLVVALVFGLGTLLTKAHYTGDLLGALLLSHAVATVVLQASGRLKAAPRVAADAHPGALEA
jgi:membrane-associated phospholipid phosphatase